MQTLSFQFDFDHIASLAGEIRHELEEQDHKIDILCGEIDELMDEYESVTSKIEDGIFTTVDAAHLILHAVKQLHERLKEGL